MSKHYEDYVTPQQMYFAFRRHFIPSGCTCDDGAYYHMTFDVDDEGLIYKISVSCAFCHAYDWYYDPFPESCLDRL